MDTRKTLDQFELINTDSLRGFHFGQLKWALDHRFQTLPLYYILPDADTPLEVKHVHPDERLQTLRDSDFARIAVADHRPFTTEPYNEVELQPTDHGIRATCTCEWSTEGWEDRNGVQYPYRACSHIMAAIASYEPKVMDDFKAYNSAMANAVAKRDALSELGAYELGDL